ncbi:hypothetical protein MKZ38_006090 [Zalerion maritima]|uniref:Uncharacterized protein n=1 Tax=Zalerion maritima TaxID=339359 RepID=A0AAD5WU16_9PEZI|nr:hypothetical protein MKZ38_006090 [Zalerion maritima]
MSQDNLPSPFPGRVQRIVTILGFGHRKSNLVPDDSSSDGASQAASTPRTSVSDGLPPKIQDSKSDKEDSLRPENVKREAESKCTAGPSRRRSDDKECLFCNEPVVVPAGSSYWDMDVGLVRQHFIYTTGRAHRRCADPRYWKLRGWLGHEISQGVENRAYLRAAWNSICKEAKKGLGKNGAYLKTLARVSYYLKLFERLDKEVSLCLEMIQEAERLGSTFSDRFEGNDELVDGDFTPSPALSPESSQPHLAQFPTAPAILTSDAVAGSDWDFLTGYESYRLVESLIATHELSQLAATATATMKGTEPYPSFELRVVKSESALRKAITPIIRNFSLTGLCEVNLQINRDLTAEFEPSEENIHLIRPVIDAVLFRVIYNDRVKLNRLLGWEMNLTADAKALKPQGIALATGGKPSKANDESGAGDEDESLCLTQARQELVRLIDKKSLRQGSPVDPRFERQMEHLWGRALKRLRVPSWEVREVCKEHSVTPQTVRRILRALIVDRCGRGFATGDDDYRRLRYHGVECDQVRRRWKKQARVQNVGEVVGDLRLVLKDIREAGEKSIRRRQEELGERRQASMRTMFSKLRSTDGPPNKSRFDFDDMFGILRIVHKGKGKCSDDDKFGYEACLDRVVRTNKRPLSIWSTTTQERVEEECRKENKKFRLDNEVFLQQEGRKLRQVRRRTLRLGTLRLSRRATTA